jgi:hypothetical protein
MALNVLLSSWVSKPATLCFSEHWLNKEHLLHINIDYYKLAANFYRISNRHGDTCIFALNDIKTRELSYTSQIHQRSQLRIYWCYFYLHLDKKGQLMNTWERFHIYKLSKGGIQLNDIYADTHNPIFKLVNSHSSKNQY